MASKFIKSKRGENILVHDGFTYHKHSTKKERTHWVCSLKPECKARATTILVPPRVVNASEHTHAPDQDQIKASEIINSIKKVSVSQPEAPPIQITSNRLQNVAQVSEESAN